MQGNSVQGGGNSPKQGGLSWSQPAGSAANTSTSKTTETKTTVSKPATTSTGKASTANMNKDRSNTSIVGFFVGGLILGGLLAWGWFALRPSTEPVATNTDTDTTQTNTGTPGSVDTGTVGTAGTGATTGTGSAGTGSTVQKGLPTLENNTITLASQTAGMQAVVSSASVVVPTWVVIYDNQGGQPGKALGAGLIFPTSKAPISIDLLRPLISGKTYLVGERADNGDHQYSSTQDPLILTAAGKTSWMQFQVK